jgi:Ca2+-binding RTX toxin-like protein
LKYREYVGGPRTTRTYDPLTGNQGSDTFYFNAGFGTDTITDFTATGSSHDVIDFAATLFPTYPALSSHMAQVGSAVVITYDGSDTVTLQGVTLASLSATDFAFHGAAANAQIHIA